MVAVLAMCATMMAGDNTYSYSKAFTVEAGNTFWYSAKVNFDKKRDHTMKVDFDRTYAKGKAKVGISKKNLFGDFVSIKSTKIAIDTGTNGVRYQIEFPSVSSGKRYYIFGSDATVHYKISYFSDSWDD